MSLLFFVKQPPVTPSTPSPLSPPCTHEGVWLVGGHKGPFLAVQRLDCSYLPQKVSRSCGSGFGAECILPPASRAGISATTLWPLRHRWHWIREETRGMREAEIRKLEDIITALLALKNKYSGRQTLSFLSQTERLRRDDGDPPSDHRPARGFGSTKKSHTTRFVLIPTWIV